MIKALPLLLAVLSFIFAPRPVRAQVAVPSPPSVRVEQPVQLMVDLGQGLLKVRESHRGLIGPVAVPVGQQVTVTLRFVPSLAGAPLFISSLDGGEFSMPHTPAIGADGTFRFQFRPDNAPGSYRLVIRSLQEYAVTLYGFDPNNPPGRRVTGR